MRNRCINKYALKNQFVRKDLTNVIVFFILVQSDIMCHFTQLCFISLVATKKLSPKTHLLFQSIAYYINF